jgi:hypothetical protein
VQSTAVEPFADGSRCDIADFGYFTGRQDIFDFGGVHSASPLTSTQHPAQAYGGISTPPCVTGTLPLSTCAPEPLEGNARNLPVAAINRKGAGIIGPSLGKEVLQKTAYFSLPIPFIQTKIWPSDCRSREGAA